MQMTTYARFIAIRLAEISHFAFNAAATIARHCVMLALQPLAGMGDRF
jgi:hypothetical protein